ncbi:protein SanA, affects membrane permeability for vancomycin [Rhodococcoides kyotonense]|uniref:Protein SanA, affects membrane permeability for vancomycin n=2 Tax=Rhodococcoides kyotonense TaxID=398843 RepID=A0A239IKW9_9NOCA|nr:protein SanA, affects membrane permeability for vancomycin [Rhodococcus kyotonensis]
MVRVLAAAVMAVIAIIAASTAWVAHAASGHVHDVDDAPEAPVVIVLGAVVHGGKPGGFLSGRLDAAIALVESGKAEAILVSGNADGTSGNEIDAMTEYLVDAGIDRDAIAQDDYGIDTYDSCVRAATTFGVTKALVVSQPLHVSRAVALCRDVGIDADGVTAGCECGWLPKWRNYARELLARPKVALDLLSGREPAVVSEPDNSLSSAVS